MRRTIIAIPLLAALAAGCGAQQSGPGVASVTATGTPAATPSTATPSTSTPSTSTPTATTTADRQEQGRKFAQCMREHGVPMEDPDPDGGGGLDLIGEGVDKRKVNEAVEACRAHAPFLDRKALKPEDVDRMREFAACMRKNGVDMPDPNPDGTFGSGAARNFRRDDPQFKKAFEACRESFPRMGAAK
ncbi:hypothetical protein [Nonomuraea candida]|uniref:hypothetical protein n=1 Tax=Nonomuraea candida TaxID=359159 RepID=UPI00069441C1|nr:hypothetical protein [Nonomuraea candida]